MLVSQQALITDASLNTVSNNNTIEPFEISAEEFTNHFETYESRLIKIRNLSFTTADGSAAFKSTAENLNVTSGNYSLVVRTAATRDYTDNVIPAKADVTGIAMEYFPSSATATSLQLSPRMAADIVTTTTAIDAHNNQPSVWVENKQMVIEGFNGLVAIYNIQGALLRQVEVSDSRTFISLPHGIYMIKANDIVYRIAL